MPYIITNSLYPSDIVNDVAKRYIEAMTKYPPNEKLATEIVPCAVKSTHEGIQVISIAEVKEGKMDEAYKHCLGRMVMFQNIQGFEYRMDIYATAEEAFQLIGMSQSV